jgi:hypothetical protein
MSNSTNPSKISPKGPEGVPVDAPGNDGPAVSPHAVSRMHRAEDDEQALAGSPDHHDQPRVTDAANNTSSNEESSGTGGSGRDPRDDSRRGLESAPPSTGDPNPAHHSAKRDTDPPRGLGDGELMEQPESTTEARQPGAK